MIFVIGIGSFIGGAFRYMLSNFIQNKFLLKFPFGTLTVNITGCLLIGIIYELSDKGNLSNEWKLFLATGILGGFTTFSAFSIETISLMQEGEIFYATVYIILSVLLGLLATYIGISIVKIF